jgi:hypothetical protein
MNGILRHKHLLILASLAMVAVAFHRAPGATAQTGQDDAVVHLQADGLTPGRLTSWPNGGAVGGRFALEPAEIMPVVETVAGHKAVTFSGHRWLQSTVAAPDTITGNSDYTVAVWVYNPTVEGEECVFTWSRRVGRVGTGAQLNYGTEPEFGAVSHWLDQGVDMGFDGGVPVPGRWHHIALTFDGCLERLYVDGALNAQESKVLSIHPRNRMRIGCADDQVFFSGSLARLQVYGGSLCADEIGRLATDIGGKAEGALVNLDAADLPDGPIETWANQGSAGGAFEVVRPQVASVDGRTAVILCGRTLNASFSAPAGITGQSDYTVAIWARNPDIGDEECMLAWARRGGDTGTGAQINFGSSWSHGAVSHWGGDIGFQGWVPSVGQWHHIVVRSDGKREEIYVDGRLNAQHQVSLNISSGHPLYLGSAGGECFFSGALSDVRIYDRALDRQEIRQLYMDGSGPALVQWWQDLEHVRTLLEKGDNKAAITRLTGAVDGYCRWIDANPREVSSSHRTHLHDACRLLAQLKLAAGAADGEITDLIGRSSPALLSAAGSVEADLWLSAHVSSAGAARALPLFQPADEDRFARVEALVEQFEIVGNWSAFERFLDALPDTPEDTVPLGRAAVASLRGNGRWLAAFYTYCRDHARWCDTACELADLLARQSAMEDRFAEAADFYGGPTTRSESSASRSTSALLASDCLLKDGQCERAITVLDSIGTEPGSAGQAPNRTGAGLLRARALMRLHKFAAAFEVLRGLQAKDAAKETPSEILFLEGCCRLAQDDPTGAAELFRALVQEVPPSGYAGRARLLLRYSCDGRESALAAK